MANQTNKIAAILSDLEKVLYKCIRRTVHFSTLKPSLAVIEN